MKRQFLYGLVAVLTINFVVVASVQATEVYIVDDGVSVHVGRLIVVTDPTPSQSTACGEQLFEYLAVIIQGGPAIHTTIIVDPKYSG